MANIWRHCVEWVTALRSNLFTWARIKLTAVYLLIILIILGAYSTVLFVGLKRNIRQNTDLTQEQEHHIVEKAIDHIQALITTIDIIMFLFAAVGSYWLAGITLRPIRNSLLAQTTFSADASHELRTPLAVMKTDIEVLLRSREPLPESATRVLQSNLEEINFMSTMTDQLLQLSRTQAVRQPMESIDLADVLHEVTQKFEALADEKNVHLKFGVIQSAFVIGNRPSIIRIVQNIIANAIAYTLAGGSVTVALRTADDVSLITVADTGIGISAKDLPHVFKRFYKVDSSRTTSASSSGLGLALAKQLAEDNHGSIAIVSELGQGTTVTVQFPVQ